MNLKRLILLSTIITLLSSTVTEACSVCFNGIENDPGVVALKWSMICMLAVLLVVLALFAMFFLGIRKKEKLLIENH